MSKKSAPSAPAQKASSSIYVKADSKKATLMTESLQNEAEVKNATDDEASKIKSKKKQMLNFKGKKKKAIDMGAEMEIAQAQVRELGADYDETGKSDEEEDGHRRSNLLRDIKKFDRSKLGSATVELDHLKGVSQEVTLKQNVLCQNFWDGSSYPIHKVKFIVLQIPARDEVTLNFSGIAQLTDVVFAVMKSLKKTEESRFKAVKGIILDGCYHLTDAGLEWMTESFSQISQLSIVGLHKVTESGILTLHKLCPRLLSIDLSGTSVNFLPKRWIAAEGMKMTNCPMLFPMHPADVKTKTKEAMKDDSKGFVKVSILTCDNATQSLLAVIKGEKQTSPSPKAQFLPDVSIDGNLTAVVTETDQSLSSVMVTNNSIVVIQSELKDKTMIVDEAASISAMIMEVLGKHPNSVFLIVGCSTDTAGIVPMDLVKEEVIKRIVRVGNIIRDSNYSLNNLEQMTTAQQVEYSTATRIQHAISTCKVDSVEINCDKGEKEKFLKGLVNSAKDLQALKEITYSKEIYDWAKAFHTKCPSELQSGLHSHNQAADIICNNSSFKERLRPFGAVDFLISIGKLCKFKSSSGETMVTSTSWLCQCLELLLSPSPDTNSGLDYTIADDAPVWKTQKLQELAQAKNLDFLKIQDILKQFPHLWLLSSSSLANVSHLPEKSVMPTDFFTEFDKSSDEGGIHVAVRFVLNNNMTPAILHRIMANVLRLHSPIHVWRTGIIIYDGIVAVMIGQTGYSKIFNVCAYMTSKAAGSKEGFHENAKLIFSTVEKYKLVVAYELASAGFIWETLPTISDSLRAEPQDDNGALYNHIMKKGEFGPCRICGIRPSEASMLAEMDTSLNPSFLGPADVRGPKEGFEVEGSKVKLKGICDISIKASLDPLGCRQCSILLMQGNVKRLQIIFSSGSWAVVVDLHEQKIQYPVDGKTESVDISKNLGAGTLQGETITACIKGDDTLHIEVFLGPKLLHTIPVPVNIVHRLGLSISSTHFTDASNEAFVSVHDSNFKHLLRSTAIEIGMRLEALDRLNPSLICVATLADFNPDTEEYLIHFDGWNNNYDYWTKFSHEDLHPLGFMAHNGEKLSQKQRVNSNLQKPHRYSKAFDWTTYLEEIKAEPVPYGCFSEKQTLGTPEDDIDRVLESLTFSSVQWGGSDNQTCRNNPVNATKIEYELKQYFKKLDDKLESPDYLESLGDSLKHFFCFLPQGLSVDYLRYPSLASVYSNEKQNIHFLCPGQVLDFHFVNHSGLPMAVDEFGSLKSWSKSLKHIYSILTWQKNTLPKVLPQLCAGADNIPVDKSHELEKAVKRLYKWYLMHCMFFNKTDTISELDPTQLGVVDKILDTAMKSEDHSFGKQFNQSPEQTQMLCHAHRLANSPGAGLQEIKIDMFHSLASNIFVIHLEKNPLPSLPEDFFTHFCNLTQLWLDNCNIADLPSMQKNICLEELHVKGNKLTTLPEDMKQLSTLRLLDISNNPMEILPSVISKLVSLVELYADNIGTLDLNLICPLVNLSKLSIAQNYIESIPDKFSALPLTVLDISGLPAIAETGVTFSMPVISSFIDGCTVYRRTTTKERQEMFETISKIVEKGSNPAMLAEFNKMMYEKFPRFGNMAKQEGKNVPDTILKIKTLKRLSMHCHAFLSVQDEVKNLTSLEYLSLGNNPYLETVSAELANIPLKELHMRGCPNLKTPPKEVVRRGFPAVYGYLKRLLQGSVSCRRTKLMMVGLGGAGKTSLVRALTNKKFKYYEDYGEKITDGIDITEWKVDVSKMDVDSNDKQPLHFSVWDFAGQTVYYNTHQFFLSSRAVYLLLWNIRLGYEHAGLDFWLSSIACHAPKAPILIVGTHCDKVEKGKLPTEELKRRFPQIDSFHYVSSYSGEGIPNLSASLIKSALAQKYMGEKIPEAWLSLEKQLDKMRVEKKEALLPWNKVEDVAGTAGIFDKTELVQAVQFLHDLGAVQFFNTNFLRSHVVIIPQWIVDVMACIVTVHEGPIKDGKMYYSDMKNVWRDYPAELHTWLLRLTEEFDLTFPIHDEDANIIPCLLPDTVPEYDFPSLKKEEHERESKMIYKFDYLPAGLFNRAQVRLHQFSDSSVMWKKGFMLKKNNHRALLLQIGNTEVVVVARGYKPENTLFLVHEVFECLIADSYSGVFYDYSIPCAECSSEYSLDPCMFPASKIKRAFDMKAPFLQCDKNFHIISLSEIQASMPPDLNSDFDEHLGRSVRELQDLQEDLAVRVLFIYSRRNIPDLANTSKVVDPTQLLEDMKAAGMNVSYCDDPETTNMEAMTLAIKSVQIVVIGISDEFVESEQCRNLIIYIKNTLNKPLILVTLGKTLNWQKTDINIVLADEVFVKMTQLDRYQYKLPELLESIKTRSKKKKIDYPECFISYCWANSKTAVELGSATKENALGYGDPRKIKDFLQAKGINCWLDVEQMGQEGFFEDIAEGLRKAKVMVACVSDEYANSKNCKMEFRFALSTLKIPTVLAVVGTGYDWERSEIGMLTVGHSQICPKINLQYENEPGMLDLLAEVEKFLPKNVSNKDGGKGSLQNQQSIAFQEVLELTQRKLLRQIIMYSEKIDTDQYPRLILIDIKTKDKQGEPPRPQTGMGSRKPDDESDTKKEEKDIGSETLDDPISGQDLKNDKYNFRLLCEHEQGWHESPEAVSFPKMDGPSLDEFINCVSPYMARILAILKHSKISMPILTTPDGERLRKKMEDFVYTQYMNSPKTDSDFREAYSSAFMAALEEDEERTYGGLKRCHMPNGKILWLCNEHEKSSFTQTEEKYNEGRVLMETPDFTDYPKERRKRIRSIDSYRSRRSLSIASSIASDLPVNSDIEKGSIDSYRRTPSIASDSPVNSNIEKGPIDSYRRTPSIGSDSPVNSNIAKEPTVEKLPTTPQVAVKLAQPAKGQPLPRQPKMQRRTNSSKTSSKACAIM